MILVHDQFKRQFSRKKAQMTQKGTDRFSVSKVSSRSVNGFDSGMFLLFLRHLCLFAAKIPRLEKLIEGNNGS